MVSHAAVVRVPKAAEAALVVIVYTNWRNETAERRIRPIEIFFGSTDWHTEPQWLLRAFDLERQAERDFAMTAIATWRP